MQSAIPDITDLRNPALSIALQYKLDRKTKPTGSLGRLEALALQLGEILGSETPALHQPQLVIFAADHGLAARGVSAYPAEVTWQMVQNFLSGGAAASVLARQHGIALSVADCGVARPFPPQSGLLSYRIAAGTADSSLGPAMTGQQCAQAIANGRELLRQLPGNVLLLGEMGIGNSSCAALLLARLCNLDISDCTGAGTGLDVEGVARKTRVLAEVLRRNPEARTPLDALAAFGGFEIATMTGAVLEAAAQRRVIVVDGFITSAAVLLAQRLQPLILQRCVFAHCSAERGHRLLLKQLRVRPLLEMDMRLGEGSGAVLALPLLESACRIVAEMASFESAEVSDKAPAKAPAKVSGQASAEDTDRP